MDKRTSVDLSALVQIMRYATRREKDSSVMTVSLSILFPFSSLRITRPKDDAINTSIITKGTQRSKLRKKRKLRIGNDPKRGGEGTLRAHTGHASLEAASRSGEIFIDTQLRSRSLRRVSFMPGLPR